MCKNHDEQHYPREVREAAMILAGGNAMDRDMLLRAAVHNGLAEILEVEVQCMPTSVASAALTLLKRHHRLHLGAMRGLEMRCHERWDSELERQIEAVDADVVD
jgi:hypothetical protein